MPSRTGICVVDPQDADILVSQVALEIAQKPTDSHIRLSQLVIEVVMLPNPAGKLRVSQLVIELPKSVRPAGSGAGGNSIYEA